MALMFQWLPPVLSMSSRQKSPHWIWCHCGDSPAVVTSSLTISAGQGCSISGLSLFAAASCASWDLYSHFGVHLVLRQASRPEARWGGGAEGAGAWTRWRRLQSRLCCGDGRNADPGGEVRAPAATSQGVAGCHALPHPGDAPCSKSQFPNSLTGAHIDHHASKLQAGLPCSHAVDVSG